MTGYADDFAAYETCAISGCAFTACRGRGRISAKPTLSIPYAVNSPNAIAAMHAQISIAKFNRSAIESALVNWSAVGMPPDTLPRGLTITVMQLCQKMLPR